MASLSSKSAGFSGNTSAISNLQGAGTQAAVTSQFWAEIHPSTGIQTNLSGQELIYTILSDVDVHSGFHYVWTLTADDFSNTGDGFQYLPGLGIVKEAKLVIGNQEWDFMDRTAMHVKNQLEMNPQDYDRYCKGMGGFPVQNSSLNDVVPDLTVSGSGELMIGPGGGSKGALMMAAMPYQPVKLKITMGKPADVFAGATLPAMSDFNFQLFSRQVIVGAEERTSMQNSTIMQLHSDTQLELAEKKSGGYATGVWHEVNLDHFNTFVTHYAVIIHNDGLNAGGEGANTLDAQRGVNQASISHMDFRYNSTSMGEQLGDHLLNAGMTGLAMGGANKKYAPTPAHLGYASAVELKAAVSGASLVYDGDLVQQDPNIYLWQVASSPGVTAQEETSSNMLHNIGGSQGIPNAKFDTIRLKFKLDTAMTADDQLTVIAFGQQGIYYAGGGGTKSGDAHGGKQSVAQVPAQVAATGLDKRRLAGR